MAERYGWLSTDVPDGTVTTICALAPAAEGKTAASRSIAFCDCVPGMANESLVLPPSATPPPSMPIMRISQTASMRQG
jgi:hypothetical protein